MYYEFAPYWTLISAPENYAEEAVFWRNAITSKLGNGRHEILELGVGGGNNLSHLTPYFKATAVDISEPMLENSKKLNPDVEHYVGDMRSVRLEKKFDAVIIHDAISYLLTEDDLTATFETAKAHLDRGGVFITSPDYFSETFTDSIVRHSRRSQNGVELVHVEYSYDPNPEDTIMETRMIYIIRENNNCRIEHDLHITGLFPLKTWIDTMIKVGFSVEKREYPVHEDKRQSYLLVGTLNNHS